MADILHRIAERAYTQEGCTQELEAMAEGSGLHPDIVCQCVAQLLQLGVIFRRGESALAPDFDKP